MPQRAGVHPASRAAILLERLPTALPASLYVSQPVNGTDRLYQGYDITARLSLGKDVTVIRRTRPTHRSTRRRSHVHRPGSTLILNSQLYGRPLAQRQFTLDGVHPPSGLEFLANAQYVA